MADRRQDLNMSCNYGHELGPLLPQCARDVMQTRPVDPLAFIGNWLYRSVDTQLYHEEEERMRNSYKDIAHEMDIVRQDKANRVREIRGCLERVREFMGHRIVPQKEDPMKALMAQFYRRRHEATKALRQKLWLEKRRLDKLGLDKLPSISAGSTTTTKAGDSISQDSIKKRSKEKFELPRIRGADTTGDDDEEEFGEDEDEGEGEDKDEEDVKLLDDLWKSLEESEMGENDSTVDIEQLDGLWTKDPKERTKRPDDYEEGRHKLSKGAQSHFQTRGKSGTASQLNAPTTRKNKYGKQDMQAKQASQATEAKQAKQAWHLPGSITIDATNDDEVKSRRSSGASNWTGSTLSITPSERFDTIGQSIRNPSVSPGRSSDNEERHDSLGSQSSGKTSWLGKMRLSSMNSLYGRHNYMKDFGPHSSQDAGSVDWTVSKRTSVDLDHIIHMWAKTKRRHEDIHQLDQLGTQSGLRKHRFQKAVADAVYGPQTDGVILSFLHPELGILGGKRGSVAIQRINSPHVLSDENAVICFNHYDAELYVVCDPLHFLAYDYLGQGIPEMTLKDFGFWDSEDESNFNDSDGHHDDDGKYTDQGPNKPIRRSRNVSRRVSSKGSLVSERGTSI